MSPDLDKKLCTDFPYIFKDRHGKIMDTAMCWGFDCDDGWFQIIYDLCSKISELDDKVYATQVKEKFGTLRFYINGGDELIYDLIDKADQQSGVTCEICGKQGKLRGTGWFKTLCDEHAEGYNG